VRKSEGRDVFAEEMRLTDYTRGAPKYAAVVLMIRAHMDADDMPADRTSVGNSSFE